MSTAYKVEQCNELLGSRTSRGERSTKQEAVELAKTLAARARKFVVYEVIAPSGAVEIAIRGEAQ
jgi:hypothetical protein